MFWLIKENKRLKQQLKDRDNILQEIYNKCNQNILGNPDVRLRKIKELANTFANSKSRT